jgi:energy-converting hydrogenase Eha subunit A
MKQRPIFAIYVLLWIVALVGLSNARVIAQSTDSLSVKPAIKDSLQKVLSSFQTLQSLTLPLQKEQIRGSYRLSVAFSRPLISFSTPRLCISILVQKIS